MEEIKQSDKRHYALIECLKSIMTDPMQDVDIKHGFKGTSRCYTNFFFMSNHEDALKLDNKDRRFNVFCCEEEPKSIAYYDRLYEWLENDNNVAALFYALKRRDLSEFNYKRSITTEARKQMIEMAQGDLDCIVESMTFDDFPYAVMTNLQIREYVSRDNKELSINEYQLKALISKHAKIYRGKPIRIKLRDNPSKMYRYWIFKEKAKSWSDSQIKDEILKVHAKLDVL